MFSRFIRNFFNPQFYLPFVLFAGSSTIIKITKLPLFAILFILVILFLIFILNFKTINFSKPNLLSLYIYIFNMFIFFGVGYSNNTRYGFDKSLGVFIIMITFFLLEYLVTSYSDFDKLLIGLITVSMIFLIGALPNLITYSFRLSSFVVGVNIFGRFMYYGLISSLLILLILNTSLKRKSRIIIILMITFYGLMMFLSGSRGVMIGFILSTVTIGLMVLSKMKFIKIVKYIPIASSVLLILLILIRRFTSDYVISKYENMFSDVSGGSAVSSRFDRFYTALEMFKESPIFGKGTGSFFNYFNTWEDDYPHNIILELMAENGIIGLLLFMIIISFSVFYLIRTFKLQTRFRDNHKILYTYFILAGLIFSSVTAMFSGDIYHNRFIFFFIGLSLVNNKIYIRYKFNGGSYGSK